MLGYVRTDAKELKIRTQTCYQGLYCGLCKQMGKCTGNCSRMTLSYDFVFLAAVRMALLKEVPNLKKSGCFVHPLKRIPRAKESPTLSFCADATAILSYHKNLDNLADEKGAKKLFARLCVPFLSVGYRKAKKRHPHLDAAVSEKLKQLHAYEKAPEKGCDYPSILFGDLMGEIFSADLPEPGNRIAKDVGFAVGRWIYLVDAADDFAEDQKKRRFNPLLQSFGAQPSTEDWDTLSDALKRILETAANGFELMDGDVPLELREIIENILYLGLPAKADAILSERKQTK